MTSGQWFRGPEVKPRRSVKDLEDLEDPEDPEDPEAPEDPRTQDLLPCY